MPGKLTRNPFMYESNLSSLLPALADTAIDLYWGSLRHCYAMLCVLARFTIRILKRRPIRWDDALVLFATLCFITAYGVGLSYLDALYLLEGINKKVIYPFQEDISRIMSVSKWSYIFASMNWTTV